MSSQPARRKTYNVFSGNNSLDFEVFTGCFGNAEVELMLDAFVSEVCLLVLL